MHKTLATIFYLLAALAGSSRAESVQVAVAANFAAPAEKIAQAFAQDTGHRLVLALGATGKFYAQIKNGAPFEVLLAADQETPARLEREGLTLPGSRFTYAVGRLVLWSPRTGLVDGAGDVLRQARFDKMALADPKVAPYGRAAVQVLEQMGLRQALRGKTVQGESIATAYRWVEQGQAALGFVAMSQVMADGKPKPGSVWLIPSTLYDPIRQDAVALAKGQGKPAAAAFMAYLNGERARAIIASYGYSP